MSAELNRATGAESWAQWESQLVNGVFPLRRLLGCSGHGAVFLTEHKSRRIADAAIKLVRADALHAKGQLKQWEAVSTLSHPHLLRLLEAGRYQHGGQEYLFVVMEHAEQTLAQILRRRALSAEEARELLLPMLDALSFLHRRRLTHGQVKPSNLLAVNDQLTLSSDRIRPAGPTAKRIDDASSYDPPEDNGVSSAGDIWCLGMTLAEALTQRTPGRSDRRDMASLIANLPAPFADTVRRCLSLDPADRPSAPELAALYKPAPQAPSASTPQPPAPPQPDVHKATPARTSSKRPVVTAIAVAVLLALAAWVGMHVFGTSQTSLQTPVATVPATPIAPSVIEKSAAPDWGRSQPVSQPPASPALPSTAGSPAVIREVTPNVPSAIREKIRGRIYVTVRVLVDPSGNVIGALLEESASSKYFVRLAEDAAREWQFAPADVERPRVWLVRFEFTSDGDAVRAVAQ